MTEENIDGRRNKEKKERKGNGRKKGTGKTREGKEHIVHKRRERGVKKTYKVRM